MTPFEGPNYTQAPNEFLDAILPEIDTLGELKVTIAIIRQTFGWHRKSAGLTLTKLEKLTGLRREAVNNGVAAAMERGYVTREKEGRSFCYALNVGPDTELPEDPSVRMSNRSSVRMSDSPLDRKKEKAKKKEKDGVEHPEFQAWIKAHEEVTGHSPPGPRTKALQALASSYLARREEGWTVDQLLAAILGAHKDDWRREHGYDVAESILRPTKIGSLVNKGEVANRPKQGARTPMPGGRRMSADEMFARTDAELHDEKEEDDAAA